MVQVSSLLARVDGVISQTRGTQFAMVSYMELITLFYLQGYPSSAYNLLVLVASHQSPTATGAYVLKIASVLTVLDFS